MQEDSGVLIRLLTPTDAIVPGARFPGDIDLLVIPFRGNKLILSRALAIEVKIVRAKYVQQGKGPNQFGFSQAVALFGHGFPQVAVAHIIVSDQSPIDVWIPGLQGTIVDADEGLLSKLVPITYDPMPGKLISRCFGRLVSNTSNTRLGLISTYFQPGVFWQPECREATVHYPLNRSTLDRIGRYYYSDHKNFLETYKFSAVGRSA